MIYNETSVNGYIALKTGAVLYRQGKFRLIVLNACSIDSNSVICTVPLASDYPGVSNIFGTLIIGVAGVYYHPGYSLFGGSGAIQARYINSLGTTSPPSVTSGTAYGNICWYTS